MRIELHKVIKEAFKKLNYREREIVYAHLGLCPECMRIIRQKKTYQEIAYENGWMTKDEVRESCKDMLKTEYGQYLMRMIEQ